MKLVKLKEARLELIMNKYEFEKKLISFISDYQGIDVDEITLKSNLIMDLALTSMELFEVFNQIEIWLNIELEIAEDDNFETLEDVVNIIYKSLSNKNA